MEIPNHGKFSLGKIILGLALLAIFVTPSHAQTKEVEIEVVGPWTYAPYPGHPQQILLLAPIAADHKVDVFSGGDAYEYKKDATPGSYIVAFDTVDCSNTQSKLKAQHVDFTVQETLITKVAGTPGRYAISLPKPCYFETYLHARAILSKQAINPPEGEANYVIWMKLHYTVPLGLRAVKFSGQSDSGNATPIAPSIAFANSANPPKAEAISVVLYDASDVEDYDCDSYSAHFFDAVTTLWGQQGWYRLFPELDGNHNQAEPYNTKCSQQPASPSAETTAHGGMKSAKMKVRPLQQHKRTAGRADCHSTQVSLNGAVQ